MGALINDIRYGLRMLLKSPGSTAVALVALGFGIGANSAIFSVVNGVLLRPLPYQDPDRLTVVWETKLAKGIKQELVSPAEYRTWASENRVFDRMAALRAEPRVLTGGELPERVETILISPGAFEMLGAKPALGRTFSNDENQPGRGLVALLSYGLWQRRFGGDPSVLGKAVILDGIGYTVVGVTPRDFHLLDSPSDLWIPYTLDAKELNPRNVGVRTLRVIAHLKPGATLDQAQTEMRSVDRRLELLDPDSNSGYSATVVSLRDQLVGNVRTTLWMLLGAVLFVLLIACANVANLLLARAGSREKEIALRSALGANPARLMRQLLTESLLMALAGGLLGLLLAGWSISLLKQLGPASLPRLNEIGMDWRVLSFTLLVSLATGIVFGLAPALASIRSDLNSILRSTGRGATGGPTRAFFRNALVVSEMAACVVLLTGAGLLIRSFARLQSVNPGFRPEHVLTMQIALPESRYSDFKVGLFYKQLLERLQTLPGVQFAAVARKVPLSAGDDASLNFTIENRPVQSSADQPRAQYRAVTADYLDALGIPLIRGRHFDRTDGEHTPGVVLINETLARTFFAGDDALGKRIKAGLDGSVWCTIVGIVRDVKHAGLDAPNKPETYYHYLQVPTPWMSFVEGTMTAVLRTSAEPASLAAAARGEVRKMDSSLAVFNVHTMDSLVDSSLAQPRFRTTLLSAFAGVALILAAIGLYGVIAYSVARRTNELGVRMALGAQRIDVLKLVMGQAAMLAFTGIEIGVVLAFAVMRVISKLLFGVNATDPLTFTATALLILVVALAASLIPALRAIKVDPVVALRYE
jgi:putative ABC transport system permease protein